MGKSTISMAIFNSYVAVYQRVMDESWCIMFVDDNECVFMNIFSWMCEWKKKLMNFMNGWSIWSMVHDGTMNGFHIMLKMVFQKCSQDSHKMIHSSIYIYIEYILNILTTIDNLLIHWLYWPSPVVLPPAGSSAVLPPRTAALHWASGNEIGKWWLWEVSASPVKTIIRSSL